MARTDPAERQQAEEKKSERPAEEVTVQNKCCTPCRDKKKKVLRALQDATGLKNLHVRLPAEVEATGQERKRCCATEKKCS